MRSLATSRSPRGPCRNETVMTQRYEILEQGFNLLCRRSDETRLLLEYLLDSVVPSIPKKKRFLDIGPAFGRLTLPLAARFERSMIVEPDELYYRELMTTASRKSLLMEGVNQRLEAVRFKSKDYFDMILLSHVLYYIRRNRWIADLTRLTQRLTPSGQLVVVLWSRQSEAYQQSRAIARWRENTCSEVLLNLIRTAGPKYSIQHIRPRIRLRDPGEVRDLFRFLTIDLTSPKRSAISAEIPHSLIRALASKRYLLRNDQDIITLRPA